MFIVTIYDGNLTMNDQYRIYPAIRGVLDSHTEAYSKRIASLYTESLGSSQFLFHGIFAKDEQQAAHYQAWLSEMIRGELPGSVVFIAQAN